jgi:HK97 family phage major capsid protein
MALDLIERSGAEALINQQLNTEFLNTPIEESSFMKLARRLPNMTSNQTRLPVLSTLPMAYFVGCDTGFKQTTSAAWDNVYINAAEIATIVPIPEAVLADSSYGIMSMVRPLIAEYIGRLVDEVILFGTQRPIGWPLDIISQARNAGNNVAQSGGDYYDLLLGEGGVISKVEEGGFMPNGAMAAMSARAKLRSIRTADGVPLFTQSMQSATPYALDGQPLYFPRNGAFHPEIAEIIVGDFTKAVYAIRQDINVKILDQASIYDPATGALKYALAQQDMIAIRVFFRMGWALPNIVSAMNPDRTNIPFAYLEPPTPQVARAVTITVTDSGDDPIEGAHVNVAGSELVTNADGEAVFSLTAGTYPVSVSADGYVGASDGVTVASAAVAKTIVLTAL